MTTLPDIITQIRGFTGYTDVTVQTDALIISWLRMAEERCSSDLRVRDMIIIDSVEAIDGIAELPGDYRSAELVGIQDTKLILEFTPYEDFYADEGLAGTFSSSGPNLYIGGDNVSGTIDLHYFADVPILTADGGATWLSTRYPTVIIAATLAFAFISMQEPERAAQWNAVAQGRIEALNNEYKVSKTSGSRLIRKTRSLG